MTKTPTPYEAKDPATLPRRGAEIFRGAKTFTAPLTERQLGEMLDLSPDTLANHRLKGRLGYYKVGAKIRYSEKHVQDYLNSCEVIIESKRQRARRVGSR